MSSRNSNFSNPDQNDEDFQYKIYKKREFIYYKIPEMGDMNNEEVAKKYIDDQCEGEGVKLRYQQHLPANFINPKTPYTGLLIFHGQGTGKSGAAINIAENFK